MASKELLDMLNKAIAMELQVSIQYMWQHVLWRGPTHFSVKEAFKEAAIEEMKHAEMIAERLTYLGEQPTTKPAVITVGENLQAMLTNDLKVEEETIAFYKQIIKKARAEEDETTAHMFNQILTDEEEHHDLFQGLLEKD
ncbi:MAG: ferritin-like domain-containing protein [Candidatus Heimdallarchaeota archaeon]